MALELAESVHTIVLNYNQSSFDVFELPFVAYEIRAIINTLLLYITNNLDEIKAEVSLMV